METTFYKPNRPTHRVHVLGSGPYAREVARQAQLPTSAEFIFISNRDEDYLPHYEIIVGIANPTIKRKVIDEFYDELEPEMFTSSLSSMIVTPKDVWKSIDSSRAVNIGPFTSIGDSTEIGDFVAICANVAIGHDCKIGKYSTICPGAIISGNVTICDGVFIGAGAVIRDGVYIGDNAVIGCGAVVVGTVLDGLTVAGNPAKPLMTVSYT
jgi:acetyltransferase-like isoleucine patch superfamily enzyme